MSESEDPELNSWTPFVPSGLDESSDNTSISEIQNDGPQIVDVDTIDYASDTADNDKRNEDILKYTGRKMIRDETKWKRNIQKNLRNVGKRFNNY